MQYIYGSFTDKQINEAVRAMHNDIHKLLLYKDNTIEEKIFEDDEAFLVFFENVMFKLGGTKTLFNDNGLMVTLMATLQGAMDNFKSDHFSYKKFRRAIDLGLTITGIIRGSPSSSGMSFMRSYHSLNAKVGINFLDLQFMVPEFRLPSLGLTLF